MLCVLYFSSMERPIEAKRKSVAAFDVDGSLYRGNLALDLTTQLVRDGIFPARFQDEYHGGYEHWKANRHHDSYQQFVREYVNAFVQHIAGVKAEDVEKTAAAVIAQSQGLEYVYTRNLIQSLKDTHTLVAISGSPVEIVTPFVNKLGIDHVHATTMETENGIYTGQVEQIGTYRKDQSLLNLVIALDLSLNGSVAVGDTDSDIPLLEMVDIPIAFNPSKKLFQHALDKKWKIIYERKDMILEVGSTGTFSEVNGFGHYRESGL